MIIAEDYYRSLLLREVTPETEWLDLGCGWQLLREWLPSGKEDAVILSSRARRLVGLDYMSDGILRNPYLHDRLVGDVVSLPFAEASFNLVTAQMVIEHLERPDLLLREVKRILRDGGKFIFLTPNYMNYQIFVASFLPDELKKSIVGYLEGRPDSDIFKAYYRMNTRNRVSQMAREQGFRVEEIYMLHSDFEFRRIPLLYGVERALYAVMDKEIFSTFRADILAVLVNSPGGVVLNEELGAG
jgi:ubiquinone/menaquinone biosynthesis C-methylase UbiE